MKHIDYRIERLLHEGFAIGTLEKFSSKQIQVLYEKVKKNKKKEVKEQPKPIEKTVQSKVIELPSGAKTAIGGSTITNQGGKTVITTTATESEFGESEEEDIDDVNKGEDDQDPIQKQGPDGMPTEGYLEEKSVSKQQQKIMGLALSVKKGKTPKSKVSKNVQKMAKEMTKKDLEDFAKTKHKNLPQKIENEEIKKIEENILRLVQNHIPPHSTKKELINYISKKR